MQGSTWKRNEAKHQFSIVILKVTSYKDDIGNGLTTYGAELPKFHTKRFVKKGMKTARFIDLELMERRERRKYLARTQKRTRGESQKIKE